MRDICINTPIVALCYQLFVESLVKSCSYTGMVVSTCIAKILLNVIVDVCSKTLLNSTVNVCSKALGRKQISPCNVFNKDCV